MNGQTKYADLLRSWEAVQAAFKGIGAQACQGSIKAEPSDTAYAVLTYSEMLERIGHIKAELGDMTAEHMDDLCAELKHLETSVQNSSILKPLWLRQIKKPVKSPSV